ncbi:MAG: hypothetical protein IPM98_15250 [Lewinellaceae bacterium]|nr:hypothetical protein [Lewinellaceae bacterium]
MAQGAGDWICFGNNGGLLEFDGARWQTFYLPENQTVRAVATGPDGRVYCGGFAEFGYWQPDATGAMTYYSLSKNVRAEHLDREEIWHILATEQFVLFQSFSTIYKYDFAKTTVLQPPNSIMFAHEVHGRILVPVIERGLYELLPDNTFRFVPGTEPLANEIVQFLVPHGADGIWAGSTNHGIFEIADGSCHPWKNPLNAVFQKSQLNKAVPLHDGGWAIGTILGGAYILDRHENLRYRLHRENGLQNNTVLALREDRSGNLWLGLDRGIDLVALNAPITFFTDLTGKMGTVYSAARWNGQLYIGTNQGVFMRENSGFRLVDGSQGQVWELRIANNQLLCGHNAGTFRINGTTATRLSDVTGGWCTVPVPGRPDLLLQSTYTGLVVFHCPPDGAWRLQHRVGGFGEPLKKILFDPTGALWGAHPNKGLYRLRLNTDLTEVLEIKSFRREDGLPTDFALDLSTVNGAPVVNAQSTPLQLVDSTGKVLFRPLTRAGRRQKWLCGANGDFFASDSSGVTLQTRTKAYPLPIRLVPGYENIVAIGPDEYLFCLENGFARLEKHRLLARQYEPPPARIRRIETGAGQALPLNTPLRLPYQQNSLRLLFTVPAFEQPPLFSWRLDGLSADWSPWQNSPEKAFDNLPAGNYVFRVRAGTGGAEATLPFRILQPWYRTGWALAAYLLLLFAALYVLEKISQTRLLRQRRRLEAEKQQELGRQRVEAEREKFALELDNKNRELSNAALSLIRKNEALQHLRDELLKAGNDARALQKLARQIDQHLEGDHDWDTFETAFNQVHNDFFKRILLEYPELTPGDLRLAAYLKLNLSSKEIAPLLNISVRGVENKRYRLRKKLGLPEEANLTEFILGY